MNFIFHEVGILCELEGRSRHYLGSEEVFNLIPHSLERKEGIIPLRRMGVGG